MVVMNLEGETVEGDFLPSVDSASHLYIYRVTVSYTHLTLPTNREV